MRGLFVYIDYDLICKLEVVDNFTDLSFGSRFTTVKFCIHCSSFSLIKKTLGSICCPSSSFCFYNLPTSVNRNLYNYSSLFITFILWFWSIKIFPSA